MPKLKRINLNKGDGHNHPDIKVGERFTYLAKIDGEWFVGHFDRQWYGLNFDGWYNHLQFDTPGTNCSNWQELYQLRSR